VLFQRTLAIRAIPVFLTVLAFGGTLSAQETRGQILGRVLDPAGAIVVGAKVEAVNTATNVANTTQTNASGDYVLPFLIPGSYTVTAELTGFKKSLRQGIIVQVNDRVSVDFALELGRTTESVNVTAESPLLQTATASSGAVIDNRRVLELPLKDGNAIMLSSLAPGVMNLTSGGVGRSRPFDNQSISGFSANGAPSANNDFTLDGAPNMTRNNIAFPPPAELVQEFRIEAAAFDASQGFTPGAVINVSLKSGTNAPHGSGYYFGQNNVLNANSYFNNLGGLPKTQTYLHRLGANGSGPVFIPKVYNGKNRTFWTYGFEEMRDYAPETPSLSAVPLPAQKTGDFSGLLALGAQYQIYDPATIAPAGNGRYSRQPLPGNIIPSGRINPVAAKVVQLYDPANQPGTADGSNNYYIPQLVKDTYWTHLVRVDHAASDKNRMFFRGDVSKLDQLAYLMFNGANGENYYRWNRGLNADDVYMFTPTLLLNTRYSLTRFVQVAEPVSRKLDLSSFGFSQQYLGQLTQRDARIRLLPNINIAGYAALSNIPFATLVTNVHSFASSLTHIVGSHSMHYGAELRVYQHNDYSPGNGTGLLSFDTSWTKGPLDSSPSSPMGQGLASFLFGLPSGGSIDTNDSSAQTSKLWGVYFQDDWRVTPKLTVNFGLRYEVEPSTTERYNRTIRGFDFTVASPLEAQAKANYAQSPIPEVPVSQFQVKGGLNFAGVNGNPRGLWVTDKNNFLPRFGFAYSMNPKTVWRGGYGIFFDQTGLTRIRVNQAGYNRATVLVPSTDNGVNFIATLANPFPGGIDQPLGSTLGLMTNVGQAASFFNGHLLNPYMQRWQLSLQREVMKNSRLEVAYIGNRGTKMRVSQPLNPVPRKYYSTSPVRDQSAINFLSAAVPNPFYPLLPRTSLSGSTVSRSQLLTPFPQFTNVAMDVNRGYTWYHSLQTSFEKRLSAGYTMNVAYTWSKLMGATSFLNDFDAATERVISGEDRTHRLVVTGVWELPFGVGHKFAPGAKGFAGRMISGWQAQGIFQAQSGAPLGFGNAIFNGNLHDIPLSGGQTIYRWFNVDAGFERSSSKQLGSNVRTFPTRFSGIRGPIMNNWDLSLLKNTSVTEHLKVQFRAEFLNAFNHTRFADPNTSPSSSSFGRVTGTTQLPRVIQYGLKLMF